MKDKININLDRVKSIIDSFDDAQFNTTDVIRRYSGGFFSNKETPASFSFNAQFGKILKSNEDRLGINEIESNKAVPDDNGHETSTSVWAKRSH
ncbi:hypothetical protein [Endozoicomonas sp. 4G]|uniref:hypothetical protein n=1 Tax=Endozoicomonas sp. 4G TaxID=2872754 RepID=UPI0020791AE0|nr:hypothetical protein [Endozoicomonas sp. 4G]